MSAKRMHGYQSVWLPVVLLGLGILLFRPQPTWVPLVENYWALRNDENIEVLLDDYARQPWSALRARNAGYAALQLGQYAEAEAYFMTAVEMEGWTPELYRAMGDVYDGQGMTTEAVASWEQAFEAGLTDIATLQRLAVAYEGTGRYVEAVEVLDALVKLRPESAVTHYRLGVMLAVTAPERAIGPLETAVALDESLLPLGQRLVPIIETAIQNDDRAAGMTAIGYGLINVQEYALASVALQQAIDLDPSIAAAYAYLGLAEEEQGGDGLEAYQQALAVNPDSPLAHTLMGVYWKKRAEFDKARDELEVAYELDPLSPPLSVEIGSLYMAMGDLNTAETWYNNATRLNPDDVTLWVSLAEFYLNNDFKVNPLGYQAAERAAQVGQSSGAAHDVFGFALWTQGELEQAESELLLAAELDPLRPSTYYHLGLLYTDLVDYERARNSYERAIALDPEGRIGNLAINALARMGE